jgi:hypothetical protein
MFVLRNTIQDIGKTSFSQGTGLGHACPFRLQMTKRKNHLDQHKGCLQDELIISN